VSNSFSPTDPEDACEYCGNDDCRLDYTSDGNTLLCERCRPAYEAETARLYCETRDKAVEAYRHEGAASRVVWRPTGEEV